MQISHFSVLRCLTGMPGSSLGGFTSRGLGRFHLEDIKVSQVDLNDPAQRLNFLTKTDSAARFSDLEEGWESYFGDRIEQQLK